MKFGKYLLGSMREEWRSHFCDYKRLKELIKKITEQKLGAESKFLLTLEAEMSKVHGFYQRTLRELRQRLLNKPSDEDLHDVTLQLLQISQFAFVNETAFRKILKKHDRTSPQAMTHIYSLKLVSDDFCPKGPFDEVMLQISALYDAKHARDVPAEKNFSESNFVRKSLKFWVRLPDIAEVICMIIPHLPIYHYKGKEAKSVGSPITSIYFDTPDFYCLAGDTRVTLASGVSMRIADLKELPQVLALGEGQVFAPTQPNAFLPRLERECIELVFSDGRTLVCTADHQIKTHDGWLRADQLMPHNSQVILGIEAPLYDPREDDEVHLAKFELQLASIGVTLCMKNAQEVMRAHAFARILGYFLTDGAMSCSENGPYYTGKLFFSHRIDAERAVSDMQLVVGVQCKISEPASGRNTFGVAIPSPLLRDMHKLLDVEPGKRVNQATSLPAFVMTPSCPKSFVREFLGGLFGGDGHAPFPASASNSWQSVAFSMSKVKEHQACIAHVFTQIKELLARFSIDGISECALRDVTNNYSDSVQRPGRCVYQGKLLLPLSMLVAFQERIGFRHCAHKQQRLAVATAYLRTRDYSCKQRRRFIERVNELTGYATAPLIAGDSRKRSQLVMSIAEAYELTKVEMEQSEVYIDKDVAIPTYLAVRATLSGHNDVERTAAQLFSVPPVRWLAQVGASAFFSESADAAASVDEVEQEQHSAAGYAVAKRSCKVRYGVSRDLDGFPTWTAVFIGSKPAGRRLTFDISVPDKHNFLAEGVTVHNCYKTRMEKHEGAQLIRIRWYGNERPKEGEEVFVERKLHHESWVREQSTKTRFKITEKEILPYLKQPAARYKREQEEKKEKGRLLVDLEVISEEKKQKEARKKAEEQLLKDEIQKFVQEHNIRPMLRTQYLRAAFQLPHDNTVRISLDTELTMMRERVDFEREWYVPPERLLESDLHRFPFAVLEVKLQEEQEAVRPAWVTQLMASPLLIPAEKFSKFCHGCAILYPNRVPIIPYWLAGELSKHFKEEIHPAPTPHVHHKDGDKANQEHLRDSRDHSPHGSPRGRRNSADGLLMPPALSRDGRSVGQLFAVDSDQGVVRECWRCLAPCLPSSMQPPVHRPVQSRMKIEPKTYFANERTYLQWFNAATLLGSIALALINVGGRSVVVGILFLPVAVCLMCYALWAFQRRLHNIHERLPYGYHDPYGPTILTVVIAVALVVSGFFSVLANKATP